MEDKNILLAAKILFNSRLNKKGIKTLPQNLIPKDINESYKIQDELKILYLTLNNNFTIGKKVGCTNEIAQKQLGITEPFYGNLFNKYSNFSGCELKSNKFFKPFIEPEISFVIKEDININEAPFSFADSNKLFDNMFASIEIVDFRFGENIKDVGINNLISTNGASEYYIKSKKLCPLDSINLIDQKVQLYINNTLQEEGNTKLVLGNPINSAIWLINKLSSQGEPLLKGQFITTGTCTKAIPLKKNTFIKADFGSLDTVEFNFI